MGLENIPHKVSYRKIKYPRIEFTTGELHFVLPPNFRSEELINKHGQWVRKKRDFIAECLKESGKRELVQRSDDEFKGLVLSLIMQAADELNVELNNVIFRLMKTKWASFSASKNLMINKLGRQLPDNLLEYIVLHEFTHLKQKRHNDQFWEIIAKKSPDYEKLEKELFIYWFRIMSESRKQR
jgi:predicted metal-dependent hydrolase